MSSSSARVSRLKAMQKILDEPELSIKEPHGIQWLGLRNAMEAVYESYGSVLATLSSFAAEKNAQASGLLKYFSRHKTVLLVAYMLDVHDIVGPLSLSLQKEDLSFSEIQPLIDGTVETLSIVQCKDGCALTDMKTNIQVSTENDTTTASLSGEPLTHYSEKTESEFSSLTMKYVECLQKNIKHRFRKTDSDLFRDMSIVLEPGILNSADADEIEEAFTSIATLNGEETVTKLVNNDQEVQTHVQPLLDKKKLEQEWPMLKGMLKGSYKKKSAKSVCKRIVTVHQREMPEIAKLSKIAMSIAVTSVICERSFSYQNRSIDQTDV